MEKVEIIEQLKKICKIVVSPTTDLDSVSLDTNIVKDLGINSVGLMYLIVGIEETFKIDMSDATFNSFQTVNDVVEYIYNKVK